MKDEAEDGLESDVDGGYNGGTMLALCIAIEK